MKEIQFILFLSIVFLLICKIHKVCVISRRLRSVHLYYVAFKQYKCGGNYDWPIFSKYTIAIHVNDILTVRTFKYIPCIILIKLRKGTYLSYYLTILLHFEQHPLKAFFYHTKMKLNMFQRQMFSFCFIYYRCLKYTWALFCSR